MRKKLPMVAILLALAGLAAGAAFLWAVLAGQLGGGVVMPHPLRANAVLLDDAWEAGLLACEDRDGLERYLAQTVENTRALGGNVLLTDGKAGAGALFVDETKTLERPKAVAAWDGLWNRCDPVKLLVKLAARAGMEVCLLTGEGQAAPWQQALAQRYDLRMAVAETEGYRWAGGEGFCLLGNQPGQAAQWVNSGRETQVFLGEYTVLRADDGEARMFTLFAAGQDPELSELAGGRAVQQTLAVTYPTANGAKISTKKLFLMGTSDPNAALTLNGAGVERGNAQGVWGVLVELQYGENRFVLQNGAETLEYTVQRPRPAGGGNAAKPKPDGTVPAQPGQRLRVTEAIASALRDPGQSGSISQTLYRGAVAEVMASYQYSSGSSLTYAYRLATGDWVRAANCELLHASNAAFTAPEVLEDEASRCMVLRFTGGTPAVFHEWEGNKLKLRFLSTDYTPGEWALDENFVADMAVWAENGVMTLELTFTEQQPLYGWAVNYNTEAEETTLWLKRSPRLSDDPAAPLAGVTVLLDAGHGGSDDGAMGAAGMGAPLEKDLNLCSATAAKHRLEQLGATVLMMREDDSFPTLGDRVTALNEWHPDFFISCHHNSVELTTDVNNSWGTEAYWFYKEGQQLASRLVEEVCAATGRKNRGENYGYYYVTRSNICPATLLELGFVTNPTEYVNCAAPEAYWAEGGAIAKVIYEQVKQNTVQ